MEILVKDLLGQIIIPVLALLLAVGGSWTAVKVNQSTTDVEINSLQARADVAKSRLDYLQERQGHIREDMVTQEAKLNGVMDGLKEMTASLKDLTSQIIILNNKLIEVDVRTGE